MASAHNGILLANPADYASVAGCMRDAVSRTLPAKERHDVASQLPQDLEQLWRSMPA